MLFFPNLKELITLNNVEEMVREKIKELKDKNLINDIRDCPSIMSRLEKLTDLLPEIMCWGPLPARKLVYELSQRYNIDFGVCQFYSIDYEEQYCSADGEKVMCLCAVPEAYCIIRDKNSGPKYPELNFIRALEELRS